MKDLLIISTIYGGTLCFIYSVKALLALYGRWRYAHRKRES